jgi:hypothetical protein
MAMILREGHGVVKPVLQALLVADHVYVDAVTGKKVVAGIFHRLLFKKPKAQPAEIQVPDQNATVIIPVSPGGHQSGSPFCYISLTEVRGEQHFELRYVDLDDYKALMGTKFVVRSNDPIQTVEIVLPLPNLPAEKPGTCALELLWNDEPLGSHRINVAEITEEGQSDGT